MSHFVDYDLQPFAFRYTKLFLYGRCCLVQRERDSQHPSQRRDQEDQAESFIITTPILQQEARGERIKGLLSGFCPYVVHHWLGEPEPEI